MAYDRTKHTNQDEDFQEAMERWDLCENADKEQRKKAIEDELFIHSEDGQWSEDITEKRIDRPRFTIDKISGALDQLVGNQRQTRSGIKVIPATGGEEKTAQIYTGLIRNIETVSNAHNSYDNGYDEQLTGGYGGLCRVVTEFESDETFDQVIKLKPIRSAASSYFTDPSAEEYDKRDSMFQFLLSYMTVSAFRLKYPNATVVDFDREEYRYSGVNKWFQGDGIRVAEYWYKVPKKKTVGLLNDGRVIDIEEEKDVIDELAAQGINIVRTREIESHDIFMRLMSGAEFLTEPQPWAGKYIPLVPIFGKTAMVDGRIFIRGKVRKAKDAQRIYNYTTSANVEAAALTPKDPFFLTPTQFGKHGSQWKTFNTKNPPVMLYDPDPLAPGPPGRAGAPTVQNALIMQTQQAAQDIHATTGLEPASLGNVPELKSGKAIEAQQAMGDRGSYVFEDNLKKSKQFLGTILVDLIPRIYDTERIVKVLGEDESIEDVEINKPMIDNGINQPIIDQQTKKQVIVNDLSQGDYGVVVTSGPAFATKKQETVNQLISLSSANEIVGQLALDLIIDNMELNNKDEIKKRIRRYMVEQGTAEPTDEEIEEMGLDQEPPPDPLNQAYVENINMQTEKLIAEIRNKDADTQNKIMSANEKSIKALTDLIEGYIKQMDAGIPIGEPEVDIIEGQQALVQDVQKDTIENQEVAESNPVGPVAIEQPMEQPDVALNPQVPEGI
jgi:hypothetical protein